MKLKAILAIIDEVKEIRWSLDNIIKDKLTTNKRYKAKQETEQRLHKLEETIKNLDL